MAIRQSTSHSASPSPFQQLEGTPADSEDSKHVEKSMLLDIAFLHSIATHRPIGPHKHFNVIPILINLDRTARQVGARIRDDGYIRGASAGQEEGAPTTSAATATLKSIKKEEEAAVAANGEGGEEEEDEDDGINNDASIAFASLPIDIKMIWLRLNQLYDVDGLEELENLAIDNDTSSPFRNGHSIHHRLSSIRTTPIASATTRYGFGSGLEKKKKSTTTTSKLARLNTKKGAAAVAAHDNEDEEGNENGGAAAASIEEHQYEFELGPWDEYESLIAPRRLKSYAPHEDDQSESEEELSEPSDFGAVDEEGEEEQQEGGDDALSEGGEGDEGEEEVEEEEEEEEQEDAEEEEDTSTSKRKPLSKKQGASSSKKTRMASSPTTTKSRNTRTSAKPRRSARR